MLNMSTAIPVPNIQKVRVDSVQLDGSTLTATVLCSVLGAGGLVYAVVQLVIKDGPAQGVRANPSPLGYTDLVQVFSVTSPTAFTDLVTAYTGGIVARNKAAESSLLAAGLLPPGSVS